MTKHITFRVHRWPEEVPEEGSRVVFIDSKGEVNAYYANYDQELLDMTTRKMTDHHEWIALDEGEVVNDSDKELIADLYQFLGSGIVVLTEAQEFMDRCCVAMGMEIEEQSK